MPQFFQFPKPVQPQGPVPLPPQEAPNRPIGQDWLSDAVDLILGGIGIENPLSPQASKATQIGGLVTAGLPILGAVKAMRGAPAAAEAVQGIKAYHGSPHDFDKFSLGKIGTGEGAQAYGHGLYFAENEGIAKSYRDNLSKFGGASAMPDDMSTSVLLDNKVISGRTPSNKLTALERAALSKHYAGGIQQRAIEDVEESLKYMTPGTPAYEQELATLKVLKSEDLTGRVRPFDGRMYEVNIKADPSHFLDWDKPLSQQSPQVQEAIKKAAKATSYEIVEASGSTPQRPNFLIKVDGQVVGASNTREQATQNAEEMVASYVDLQKSGGEFYRNLSYAPHGPHGSSPLQAPAAQRLHAAGIPGIKYLDGGSRAAGEGSRNFVVFDENIIDILKKYGILAPFAGAAAASQSQPLTPQKPSVY